jgi:membrane-associated phospholipid phosphatase
LKRVLGCPATVSVGLLSLVAALRAWLQWVGPLPGDKYAIANFTKPQHEGDVLRHLTSFFSSLGTPGVAALVVGVAASVLWLFTSNRTVRGLLVACLVIPLNALLKLISGPTPLWSEVHVAGHNFPSGHVAFVTSVIGYLGWVAARRRQLVGVALTLLLVLGMGPARVAVGAHLVSDVIAGYLVGGAVLVLAIAVADREQPPVRQSG